MATLTKATSYEHVEEVVAKCKKDNGWLLLYFGAGWCQPCGVLKPKVVELLSTFAADAITALDLDVTEDGVDDMAEEHGVAHLPTLKLFHGDKLVGKALGGDFAKAKALIEQAKGTESGAAADSADSTAAAAPAPAPAPAAPAAAAPAPAQA